MNIIVQKFGGTSVVSSAARYKAVKKVETALSQGYKPVVVVSAMGRKGDNYSTDTLAGIAKETFSAISARELDHIMGCGEIISAVVMAGTMQAAGLKATVLTGGQAGIITDNSFNNARILKIDTARLINLLNRGEIPVVCGFQGISADEEFTTLGRGGSDTTAAALGAALRAQLVEIYTDVDGIMTADPRLVSNAQILDCISYGEVCQLAHQGAKVIHPRAVEIAMQKNIPLVVKSTFSDAHGTIITNLVKNDTDEIPVSDRIATGVTYLAGIAQLKVRFAGEHGGEDSSRIFRIMADQGISIDLINVYPGEIMFTVGEDCVPSAVWALESNGFGVDIVPQCAKVTVVGGGMREVPGVMANFMEALAANDINILQTVDSHTSISALVKISDLKKALTALHEKFALSPSE